MNKPKEPYIRRVTGAYEESYGKYLTKFFDTYPLFDKGLINREEMMRHLQAEECMLVKRLKDMRGDYRELYSEGIEKFLRDYEMYELLGRLKKEGLLVPRTQFLVANPD